MARFGDQSAAHHVVIAAGQHGRARRRAHGRGVEAVVDQASAGQLVEIRCRHRAAEGARRGEADIIRQDQQYVGRAFGRSDRSRVGGLGAVDAASDDPLKGRRRLGNHHVSGSSADVLLDGLRLVGRTELEPTHPDHDPEGEQEERSEKSLDHRRLPPPGVMSSRSAMITRSGRYRSLVAERRKNVRGHSGPRRGSLSRSQPGGSAGAGSYTNAYRWRFPKRMR